MRFCAIFYYVNIFHLAIRKHSKHRFDKQFGLQLWWVAEEKAPLFKASSFPPLHSSPLLISLFLHSTASSVPAAHLLCLTSRLAGCRACLQLLSLLLPPWIFSLLLLFILSSESRRCFFVLLPRRLVRLLSVWRSFVASSKKKEKLKKKHWHRVYRQMLVMKYLSHKIVTWFLRLLALSGPARSSIINGQQAFVSSLLICKIAAWVISLWLYSFSMWADDARWMLSIWGWANSGPSLLKSIFIQALLVMTGRLKAPWAAFWDGASSSRGSARTPGPSHHSDIIIPSYLYVKHCWAAACRAAC